MEAPAAADTQDMNYNARYSDDLIVREPSVISGSVNGDVDIHAPTTITGKVIGDVGVHAPTTITGKIVGDVDCHADTVITGKIVGDVAALGCTVTILGKVVGDLDANDTGRFAGTGQNEPDTIGHASQPDDPKAPADPVDDVPAIPADIGDMVRAAVGSIAGHAMRHTNGNVARSSGSSHSVQVNGHAIELKNGQLRIDGLLIDVEPLTVRRRGVSISQSGGKITAQVGPYDIEIADGRTRVNGQDV